MLPGRRGEYKAFNATALDERTMTAIDKILVVIDPTADAQPALERIARLPRPLTAQLMLLICDCAPNLGVGYALSPRGHRRGSRIVARPPSETAGQLAAPLIAQGLDVHTDARWDYPLHEAIIRKAVEWGADLVVKDTHHHSVLQRSIFSNTDWNLIRQCPTQLLLVKPRAIGHVPVVVAAVDPLHPRDKTASLDDRILTSAKELAQLFAGQTHVLHTFDISPVIMTSANGVMMPIALPMAEMPPSSRKITPRPCTRWPKDTASRASGFTFFRAHTRAAGVQHRSAERRRRGDGRGVEERP